MYILLALIALGFLVFIHELGHFFVARWMGMRVISFGIGFGKPIYSWEHKGVKWNLCWLPFGGYVKIAGMDREGNVEPQDVPDGFFGKSPWQRMLVACAGPCANLLFAVVLFSSLWVMGGRQKNFAEFTHTIGYVDPQSQLYVDGVRPGDEITAYDGRPYRSFKDNVYAPLTAGQQMTVQGFKVDPDTGAKTPFEFAVKPYEHPMVVEEGIVTSGVLTSASYLYYDHLPSGGENPLPEGSPMRDSGIRYGDRLWWMDGERLYSSMQLSHLLNDERCLATVKRGESTFLARVPRVPLEELKLDVEHREELSDWQHESDLGNAKLAKLFFIPYNLNSDCVVEAPLRFIDEEHQRRFFPATSLSALSAPLQEGDRILAVDGKPVARSFELMEALQTRRVNLIVERGVEHKPLSWSQADEMLEKEGHGSDLAAIASTIGSSSPLHQSGPLVLLNPVTPKKWSDFSLTPEQRAEVATEILEQRREIDNIADPEKKARVLALFEERQQQTILGLSLQDRKVIYNPSPLALFSDVVEEVSRTFAALLVGDLNPKWLAGPIGIVQILQTNWMISVKEALYWIGAISVNLGLLNLLPIPILDGGYILMSAFEAITGRRLKTKTLERIVLPFAVLLIGFMVFLTFHDLMRLFVGFFR